MKAKSGKEGAGEFCWGLGGASFLNYRPGDKSASVSCWGASLRRTWCCWNQLVAKRAEPSTLRRVPGKTRSPPKTVFVELCCLYRGASKEVISVLRKTKTTFKEGKRFPKVSGLLRVDLRPADSESALGSGGGD